MDQLNSNFQPVTNDVDNIPNNAISQKTSVTSYATRVFQESTVGIVSSIFTTHSKCRRFFRTFLSSLCITGFIYHCFTFLNHVFMYPEVMDISLNRSKTYNWPAYTFCNNNPVKRNIFCEISPEYCEEPSEEFCKKFSSYCGANATLMPKEKFYSILPTDFPTGYIFKLEEFVNGLPEALKDHYRAKYEPLYNLLNLDKSNIQPYKQEAAEISGQFLRHVLHVKSIKPCYSIHSRIESNKQPLLKTRYEKQISEQLPDEIIRFYLNETEMMDPRIEPGVYFAVHSPYEAGNPLVKGIYMTGGRTYKLQVEMQEEVSLKAPFDSNCVDYEELWEKNNRTGPRSKQMCQERCHLYESIFRNKCASLYNFYPHGDIICGEGFFYGFEIKPVDVNANFSFLKCLENCRVECRSLTYTTEVSVQDYVDFVKLEEHHRHIEVRIYLSNDEIKVVRHSPKYEAVDVISSVGGFMGCWLGIALMDILDVFGSIISICGYAFRKKLNKAN